MAVETLTAVPGFDLRSGISGAASQSFHQSLGCSKPLVAPDGSIHVVINEQMSSGGVRNHFVKASLDFSLTDSLGGGGGHGTDPAGHVRSWSWTGARPVRAIQGLDDACSTLVFAQGGLFHFATGPREGDGVSAANALAAGGPPSTAGAPGAAGASGMRMGAGSERSGPPGVGGGGGGGGGLVSESLPVHSGGIVDFHVNPLSRDIISGCDHGHVHVLNFAPDMMGVPSMKVSKYVGQPLSSVRWGLGEPFVASWTSSRGLLQMLDTRNYQVISSTKVEGQFPVHTHEHLSDVILAVGCGVGCVQLFDVRKMDSFVTLQDPVAGSVHQIVPSVSGSHNYSATGPSSVGDWVAFGTAGVSRYTVGGCRNGSAGAVVGASPDDGVLDRVAAGVSYAAGCRTVDLDLSAGLDSSAGLFLAPSRSGAPRLCGITLDSRVAVFDTPASGRGNGGSSVNGAVAPPKEIAGGVEVVNRCNAEKSTRRTSPVAPAFGTKTGGGDYSDDRDGRSDGGGGGGGVARGGGASGGGDNVGGSGGAGNADATKNGGSRDAGGDKDGARSSNKSGDSTGEVSKEGATAVGGGAGTDGGGAAVAGGEASGGARNSINK